MGREGGNLQMKIWEYKIKYLPDETAKSCADALNIEGFNGWELVSLHRGQAVFKRGWESADPRTVKEYKARVGLK